MSVATVPVGAYTNLSLAVYFRYQEVQSTPHNLTQFSNQWLNLEKQVQIDKVYDMSAIPSFPYELLREERTLCSVANLTRRDGEEFFAFAPRVPVRTTVQTFPLTAANEALSRLRAGKIQGAAVLLPGR